jgi:UDP-glucose 4-epimerase
VSICLVTGGAGFIGSHLVEALLARGDTVRVLDNLSSGHLENLSHVIDRIDFIEGNICDVATVQQATTDIDFIFHLAAMVSVPKSIVEPTQAELINSMGTLNVLNAAKTAGVRRLVLSSTCAIYGDEPTLPKTETMCPQPKSPYAISKLTAEHYCQIFNGLFGLETVILRYFNIFGLRQDPSSVYSGVISIFVDKLSQGLAPTIFGNGQQTRDFVFVDDVVRANLLAAEAPNAAGEIFNIGTGHPISINQLYKNLGHIFNRELKPHYEPARTGDIFHSYTNPSRARVVLGWQAEVGFEEGLKRLVETYSKS